MTLLSSSTHGVVVYSVVVVVVENVVVVVVDTVVAEKDNLEIYHDTSI